MYYIICSLYFRLHQNPIQIIEISQILYPIESSHRISSKKRRLCRGSRGKRWCSILSRHAVPCGENGWTNEISRLKGIGMMQAIIKYTCIHISHWSGKSICEVGYFLPSSDVFLIQSENEQSVICEESAEGPQGNTHSPKHLTSLKGHVSQEEKPLTLHYTGYVRFVKFPT